MAQIYSICFHGRQLMGVSCGLRPWPCESRGCEEPSLSLVLWESLLSGNVESRGGHVLALV